MGRRHNVEGTLSARVEEAELSLELEQRFQRNLAAFEAAAGDEFGYRSHEPTTFALSLTEDGYATLVDVPSGAPVYGGEPRAWARSQVEAYLGAPGVLRVDSRPLDILDEQQSAHISHSNRVMRLLQETPKALPEELPGFVNLMVMLGCGLGYQIEELLACTDIRHMAVIEPEPDIFYASLLTLEWLPVLKHFSEPGRSLELLVGEEPEDCYNRFDPWLTEIGGFNVVQPFVFQHLVGPKTVESFDPFRKRIMPERTSFLGYFDDEQVGLAHTVRNLDAGVPVLRADRRLPEPDRPVFIVANGPSLDDALDTIRAHRSRAVVVSCGTTLGSLMKAGIRPDMHVEMERDSEMREWIAAATSEEDRDQMIVLGLNTVHPDVYGLFPRCGMAMKPNDVGTTYVLGNATEPDSIVELDACNPTVANAASALAARLGFREIYLFGVDLGFPDGKKHHSQLSVHYDVADEHQEALGLYLPDAEGNTTGEGNFGGTVVTTTFFHAAATAIGRVAAAHSQATWVNTGAGLKIGGTVPMRPEDIRIEGAAFDTGAVARAVFGQAFGPTPMDRPYREDAELAFSRTVDVLAGLEEMARADVTSTREGLDVLTRMHETMVALLSDPDALYVGTLLRGSVGMFSLLLGQALHQTPDDERNLVLYRECRDLFVSFCQMARDIASSDLLRSDERQRDLVAKLG